MFTWHFKEEFDEINKPIEFVVEVLENGEHQLKSKRENKYNVFYLYQHHYLCLSYVEHEKVILIHIKPITKIPEERIK